MDPIVFPVIVVGGLVTYAGLRWYFGREQRLKRRIEKLPLRPIAQTPEHADVRVSGRLSYLDDQPPLTAPLSGRPCAAWRIRIRQKQGSGKNKRWVTILEEGESRDFALEDETGRALVDGTLVELALDFDARGGSSFFGGQDPRLEVFLHERGIDTRGLVFAKSFQFREGILEAGEKVTVAGSGQWESDPSQRGQGYRDVGKLLRLGAMSDGQLLATDDPKLSL